MNQKKVLPTVKVGQVWRDNDHRVNRTVEVLSIHDGMAVVKASTGRVTRIRLDRFNPDRQTGYTPVKES